MQGVRPPGRRRGWLAAAVLLAAAIAVAIPAQAGHAACPRPSTGQPPRAPAPPDRKPLVFLGHGNGHGVGMSQYGARGAAALGCSARQILTTYYPGVRVVAADTTRQLDVVMLEGGGQRATVSVLRDSARTARVVWRHRKKTFAVQPEGTRWTVWRDGADTRLVDHKGRVRFDRATTARFPLRGWHTNTVVRLRTYRSGDQVTDRRLKYDAAQFFVENRLLDVRQNFVTNRVGISMDKYLWGLAEVPVSWPRASLRAQAIAGRTYAVGKNGTILPTSAHQYYGGFDPLRDSPTSPWRRAVDATSGQILVDGNRRPIDALYSASMGGYTEDPRYVWNSDAVPYLRAVDDSNWNAAAGDPYLRWSKSFTYGEIATTFGFDRVIEISVAKRGRAARHVGVKITGVVDGVTLTAYVTGWEARQALGLKSPGFVIATR